MRLSSICVASLLLLGPASAQWVDGDLVARVVSPSGGCTYLLVDPTTGNTTTLLSGGYPNGFSGSAVFDSFRDVLLVNVSLPPDPYWLGRVWAVQANGSATAVAAIGQGTVRGLCAVGDGRVFYQPDQTGEIRWIDAGNQAHTLLDAAGAAPFQFSIEHLLYHPASNSLLATTSGWWSTNDCTPTACSVFRIPLSGDGSRVGGAVTCAAVGSNNQEIMSLDFLPGGQVLMCMASGAPGYPYALKTVDPLSLAIADFAWPVATDLDGAVWSARTGDAIVLDDAANVLRRFTAGSGAVVGAVLVTNQAVSSASSGYSPAENLWRIDRNGPACQGLGLPYGTGLAGLGGYVPTLGAVGCPDRGSPWSLSLNAGLGGTVGLLGLGDGPANVPALGGSLWIFPIAVTVTITTSGTVGAPGAGSCNLPLLLTDPALVGRSFWFQAALLDAAAVQGFSLTNGLQVVIG